MRRAFLCSLITIAACTDLGDLSGGTPSSSVPDGGGADAPILPSSPSDAGTGPDGSGGANYATTILADGPLAYLRVDAMLNPPPYAADATGNNRHGTLRGDLFTHYMWGHYGIVAGNTALYFSGGGLDFGQEFDFTGTSPFSFEAWVRVDVWNGRTQYLFSKSHLGAGGFSGYYVAIATDGFLVFERPTAGSGVFSPVRAPFLEGATGRWRHVVATYAAQIALYIDGELAATKPDSRSQGAKPAPFFAASRDGTTDGLVGLIDEIAIYDKALSPQQVKNHYAAAF